MKTSAEQCLELSRRLGDHKAMLAELRRMGAEQRLAALQEQRRAA